MTLDELAGLAQAARIPSPRCGHCSGARAHAASWTDAFRRLIGGGLFVIRFDHRDVGQSTHTRADFGLFPLLDDATAIFDAHRVPVAHLTIGLYTCDARDASAAEGHTAAMRTVPAPLADDLMRTTLPALVVHGTEDPLVSVDYGLPAATHRRRGAHVLPSRPLHVRQVRAGA